MQFLHSRASSCIKLKLAPGEAPVDDPPAGLRDQVWSRLRALYKVVKNLRRRAKLIKIDPFVSRVCLVDAAGAEDDGGAAGGGEMGRIGAERYARSLARSAVLT